MQKGRVCRQAGFAHLFLILGILVILSIVLLGGYFILTGNKSSESPAAAIPILQKPVLDNTKTYSNKNLGIGFDYSKDYEVVEETEEEFSERGNGNFRKNFTGYVGYAPGEQLGSVVVLDGTEDFENAPLSIWVFNNPKDLTPEGWYSQYWYYPYIWGDFTSRSELIAPTKEATISGQLGGYNIVDYRESKPQFTLIPFGDKMYLFKFPTQNQPAVIEEILESFKFLENTSKNDEVCIQVITPAKNEETGECKEFPTPCDVPEGWEKVESCNPLE